MPKSIFINIITKDLLASTAFYEAIGCVKNPMFSDRNASAMAWSDTITFMILSEKFATNFSDGKAIADQKKSVGAFYAFSLDSKEEVDGFCQRATSAGGRVYPNQFNIDNAGEFMYSFEVEDPDGYILEPVFMDISKFTSAEIG